MQVVLSFDYELFFGTNTGSVAKCMIEPTDFLLDLSAKEQIPMVFFVDIGFIIQLEKAVISFPQLQTDLDAIYQQLAHMSHVGCSLQLHIHPHWEKSHYDGSRWVVNTAGCYKLSDFSEVERKDIIHRYFQRLQELATNEINAFRAGGWCVQPFEQLEETFTELGISIDSSVFPGGKMEKGEYAFNFESVTHFSDPYRFQTDVCVAAENGRFTEVPIASWKYSPLFYWQLYVLGRLNPKAHKMVGDGSFLAQPGRKQSVLTSFTWNHASADGFYARKLKKQAHFYAKNGKQAFVVIAHPKSLTRYSMRKLQQFVHETKSNYSFSTFEAWK